MLLAISRRSLPKALPIPSSSSIFVRKFTAKGPCFSEQTIEQPAAVASEQPAFVAGGDQPADTKPTLTRFYLPVTQRERAFRENQRLKVNQRSLLAGNRTALVTQPRFRPGNRAAGIQLPSRRSQFTPRPGAPDVEALSVSSERPMGNVISCVTAEELDEILTGRIKALYRRFYLPEIVKYVWLYTKLPVGRLSYVIEIGKKGWIVEKEEMPQYYKDQEVKRLAREKEIREEILRKMKECPGIVQVSQNPEAASAAAAAGTAGPDDTTDADTDNAAAADSADDTTAGADGTAAQSKVPLRHVGHKPLGGSPRFAYKIEHMWELIYPKEGGVSGAELLEMEFLLRPPPPRFCNARPEMLEYLPLDKQKLLY